MKSVVYLKCSSCFVADKNHGLSGLSSLCYCSIGEVFSGIIAHQFRFHLDCQNLRCSSYENLGSAALLVSESIRKWAVQGQLRALNGDQEALARRVSCAKS